MAKDLSTSLRRPVQRARRLVGDATADQRAARAARARHALVAAPLDEEVPAPRASAPRAVVHAGERVRRGLAPLLRLQDEVVGADVVLLEVDASSEVAAQAPLEDQVRLAAAAHGCGIPVLAWVTGSQVEMAGARALQRLREADPRLRVAVDDAEAVAVYAAELGGEVTHLGPAADPFVHSPARTGPARRREQAVAITGDPGYDVTRLAPAQPTRLDVLGAQGSASAPDGDRPMLAHYRSLAVVADRPKVGWQVVEAAASGTPVLATPEAADRLPADIAEGVAVAEGDDAMRQQVVAALWQDELVDRAGLVAGRAARAGHTFADRVSSISRLAGLVDPPRRTPLGVCGDRGVSAVVSTNRSHELTTVADNIARQVETQHGNVQLVLVLHGLDDRPAEVEAMMRDRGIEDVVVRQARSDLTLGACLNLGVDAADGRYVAKVDDDNYYGRYYLTDLVDAFAVSGAQVVGKWCHYTWLRSSGAVVLRFPKDEHRYTRLVQGGSILVEGEVMRRLRFSDLPRAVDTDLLDRVQAAGMRTYSSDRFGYVSIRGTDRHAHTWTIEDARFMNASGRVAFYGDPREHVDV